MLRCVLFDIDNTLLLKKPSIVEKVFEAAGPGLRFEDVERAYAESEIWQGEQIRRENETGVRMADEEYLRSVFGVYQRVLGLKEEAFAALRPVFMRNYHMDYEAAPGAEQALRSLKAKGLRLGIVSNNTPQVRQALEARGLAGFFDAVVISEEAGLYKPDPRILELACQRLGVPCAGSVYVGDHPFDILCAHGAHMPAVWMPANRFMTVPESIGPAEYRIGSLAELDGALENL